VRLFLGSPPNVEKLARKGKVEGLIRALRYEDVVSDRDGRMIDLGATVRAQAALALAHIDSQEAVGGLIQALGDSLESVRVSAIRGLREHGGDSVAERLMAAVTAWTRPDFAAARADALEAVIHIGHPESLRLVAGALVIRPVALEDADLAVVHKLGQAVGDADRQATIGDLIGRLREGSETERVRELLIALAPASVDALIEALDDRRTQRDAALALGPIHESRSVPALSAVLLDNADEDTRVAAAWALGEIRHPSAVEALLVATGDDDYDVRTTAADSFDKLGNAAIALAMNVLAPRPALGNGAQAQSATLPSESEEQPTVPQAPLTRPATQVAQARPIGERARPLLRRLFGRDLPPR
jgi:HEAT repeat protein